jgi:hypothetical protein
MNEQAKTELKAALMGIVIKHNLGLTPTAFMLQAVLGDVVTQGIPAAIGDEKTMKLSFEEYEAAMGLYIEIRGAGSWGEYDEEMRRKL